jgi:phosphoglycolate phosphatase
MSEARKDIQAVLFDKDGTLFDFRSTWNVWAHGLLLKYADGDAFVLKALAEALQFDLDAMEFEPDSFVIAGTNAQVAGAIAEVLERRDVDALGDEISEAAQGAPVVPAVPLRPLLAHLSEHGYALGVMTNDTEAGAYAHLEAAGVSDAFSFVCGSDSGHGAKPDAEPLLAFSKVCGIDPTRIVMVGDSAHDLLAAKAAGMRGIGVLTGMARASELAPHADAVLTDIGELPEWLGSPFPEEE